MLNYYRASFWGHFREYFMQIETRIENINGREIMICTEKDEGWEYFRYVSKARGTICGADMDMDEFIRQIEEWENDK